MTIEEARAKLGEYRVLIDEVDRRIVERFARAHTDAPAFAHHYKALIPLEQPRPRPHLVCDSTHRTTWLSPSGHSL